MEKDDLKDYTFSGGLANVNPQGLSEQDLQKLRDITDQKIEELQHRYDQPNWWKVAAGFAKPQLGGFLASAGSAAEAMGENVEKQRAQMAPIAQMQINREQSNMLLNQRIKQNQLFNAWKASKKPMDEDTYTSIAALGNETEVAKSAKQYWDQAKGRVGTIGDAEKLASQYPRLDSAFKDFIQAGANPNADPNEVKQKQTLYEQTLNAAKPPQTDDATWAGLSREQKQKAIDKYAEDQQKIGLTDEQRMKVDHDQAIPRMTIMRDIRDLTLGKGLKDSTVKDENGKEVTLTGQQQMQRLLGMFGGDNPFEIVGRAAADGKFGELFKGADDLVRRGMMTPEARREFETLAKLLAQQQVALRSGAVNPTDAFTALQQTATPGVYNSQQALVTILDLMAHNERNNVDKYQYILTKKPDARRIGADENFYEMQRKFAKEHSGIALGKPMYDTPDYYSPYTTRQSKEESEGKSKPNQGSTRKSRIVGMNGNWWERDEKTGKFVDTGEKP